MRKIKLFLSLLILALGIGNAWGALTEEYSYTFTAKQFSNNSTAKTLGSVTWTPATTWSFGTGYWGYDATKGQQWGSSSHTLNKMILTSGTSFSNVKKIEINASIASSGGCKLSVKVGNTTIGTTKTLTTTATAYTFEDANGLTGAVEITLSNGSKKKAQYIKSIKIYTESSSDEPALSSIEISGDLTNKTYEEGDELDLTGLTVVANYESGDPKDVTNEVEWSYTPNPLTKGTTSVELTATYEDKTATQTINGLTVNEHIITPGEHCTGTLGYAFWGLSAEKTTAVADEVNYTRIFNDITINIKNGQKANAYFKSDHTRVYSGGYTMTFSVPNGYIITSIAFTASGSNWEGDHTANVGTMSDNKNWTGANQNVTITFNGTSRIASVCVTYKADVKYALTITEPTEGGTLVVKDGENTLASGAEIYEGTKLTVTATPETGYEEGDVVVKNASDEDVTATVYADGVLTMPAYAVTISATFDEKPCELLAKPTVIATTTYSSATLTWEAVANAAKYSVKVGTADAVETTETSYEVTGLNAETAYTYQVKAIAEADQDTYCDSGVAEGTFTTTAAPAAKLILKDIVGETTKTGALNSTITLPKTAAECSKTFVGWSAVEILEPGEKPATNFYASGAEYTLDVENKTLYAVYADENNAAKEEVYTFTSFTQTNTVTIDAPESFTIQLLKGSASTAPQWNAGSSQARIYAKGSLVISAETPISKIVYTYTVNKNNNNVVPTIDGVTGETNAGTWNSSEKTWTGNDTKVTFSTSGTAGNVGFTKVAVTVGAITYSNYSTTCAAAPKAEVNPTSVTATAAGANDKVEVTYENVNTESVAVALFNDAACTEAFTDGWLTASLDGDKNIAYTVAVTTLYTERKAYIKLTAPETTGATEPAVVVIPVTQAAKDKVFASLEELVAADLTEGDEVTVTLNNDVIKDFYIYSSKRCGVVFDVQKDGKDIKIYFNNQTTIVDWAVGGKLSGTLTNVKWTTYSYAWQLAPANTWAWANLTYTEPKAVSTVVVSGAPTKTTYVDGEAFDPAGLTVTVNYNDATTEVNPTGVTFTVTPATLVKGQTSVSVTATYNSVTSAAYEATGLTVNDIPTKTVAEFIAAGGTRCYLEGIVSNITNTTYGNFDLTDASGTIYVYGCLNAAGEEQKFADLGVKNGDKIKVIADEYELYGGTKDEAKNVQYVSHISAATITIADITMEVGETKTIAATITPAAAETAVTYTIKENAADAISLSGNTITANSVGTATITATVAEGATYMGNSVDFTVTVGPKTEKTNVVILAQYNGEWYAMTNACTDNKQMGASKVNYVNGVILDFVGDKASITWERAVVGNKATFKNDGKYLVGGASTTLNYTSNTFEWDVVDGKYLSDANKRTFLFQGSYFKNYAISNAGKTSNGTTYSAMPIVIEPEFATTSVLRADLYDGKWGTLCPDQKVTYMQGASFYTLTYLEMKDGMPYKLFFDEITTDYLEAGKPYLFIAEGEEIKGVKSGEVVNSASNYNGFYGNVSGNTISLTTTQTEYVADGDVVNNYGVINSRFTLLGNGTNVAHERAHVQIKNGQLDCLNPPASLPALAPGARRVVAGATGINTATGVDQVQGDEVPTKMIINGQLFILRGEKMYDAQGKLVK